MEHTRRLNQNPRHWLYLDGFMKHENRHPYLREADGRAELYENCAVYILPGEYIVGNLDFVVWEEPVSNRTSAHFLNKRALQAILESDEVSQADKRALEEKFEAFKPYVLDRRIREINTEQENLAEESGVFGSCHYNGHQVLDYAMLLKRGIGGMVAYANKRLRDAADDDERCMFEAIAQTFAACGAFIARHAQAARELLENPEPGYSEADLRAIVRTCEKISAEPPETLLEALQLSWFFMGFADYDSFGRFDQYMLPYYRESVRRGEDVKLLKRHVETYWRKLDQNGTILNMTVGGRNADGTSAVNEMTWLALEVTRELKLKGPNLCLRISGDSPDTLWEAVRLGLDAGNSLPAVYNDDVIVPMLINHGFADEDAYGYCLAGCSQVVIPGKSSFACDMGLYNPLKCLELALNDGFDPLLDRQVGPHTGAPETLDTFDKMLDAYRNQARFAIEMGVSVNNKDHFVREDFLSCIRSALTQDCMERGLGLFRGGAKYYAVQNEVVGMTNLADSLEALRVGVYEEKRYTLSQVAGACRENFENDEAMRQYLLHVPKKFGNDEERVDALRVRLTREFFTELASNSAPLGGVHWPGEVIFHYHVAYGKSTGATPDGRLRGLPMADSAGAAQGADQNGPTGILKSMMKLPFTTDEYPNTCACLNLKFTRELWNSASRKINSAFRTYFQNGGFQLQINVLNQQDLLKAQEEPEQYAGLVVRVGGYNAYFVHLEKSIQDDIIRRHGQTAL